MKWLLYEVDVLHALGVELDVASFIPVVELCDDAAPGNVSLS